MTVASTEVPLAGLGDKRLDRRCNTLIDAFASRAEASLPQALPEWSQAKAAYRFFDNDRVTPEAILAAEARATAARCHPHSRILAVQDTTSLNYSHHPKTEGLGYLEHEYLSGFFLHSTLAVTTEGLPLGLLGGHLWTRLPEDAGKKHARKQKPTTDKESVRWLRAEAAAWGVLDVEASTPVEPPLEVVMVADREADLYDLFAQARPPGAHLLVRAAQNRRTKIGTLFETLAERPLHGHIDIEISRKGGRAARTAQLSVRCGPVEILAPSRPRGVAPADQPRSVSVMAIEAVEETPPAGTPPVHWRLLTTLPVDSLEEALEQVRYYSLRWLIERYHFVLKSGCAVESLQLRTGARLQRAVTTLAVAACRLLHLTQRARLEPEVSCAEVLSQDEWQSLCARQQGEVPAEAPSLHEAVVMIACLGGFLRRRGDGEPGVKVLWRGLRRLSDIAATWQIAQAHAPPRDVGNG